MADYSTSQKYVACLRLTAKVCGMVEGHGKVRGKGGDYCKSAWLCCGSLKKFVACLGVIAKNRGVVRGQGKS